MCLMKLINIFSFVFQNKKIYLRRSYIFYITIFFRVKTKVGNVIEIVYLKYQHERIIEKVKANRPFTNQS